jgi:hypothetical protein
MKNKIITSIICISLILISMNFILAASCQPLGDAGINCANVNCNYGVNQNLNNITIFVKPNLGNITQQLKIYICKYHTECLSNSNASNRVSTILYATPKNNIVNLNCPSSTSSTCLPYTSPTSNSYTMQVFITELNKSYFKDVVIKASLSLKLSCDTKVDVGRTGTCKLTTTEAQSPFTSRVPNTPVIKIVYKNLDDVQEITDYNVQLVGDYYSLTYTAPSTPGGLTITASVDKDTYIGDTKVFPTITVSDLSRKVNFLIDDKPYSEVGSSLSTGTHTLKLVATESGSAIDVQNIEASIRSPTQTDADATVLTFVGSGNTWTTTYNFLQTGQSYIMQGAVNYIDSSKDPTPIPYTLTTAGNGATDKTTINWGLWIGIVVGVIALIGAIFFISSFARGKKRK